MRLVKLGAINSTNDYLKGLCRIEPVENFTVVTAEEQFSGRGQMGTKWISETGKNLIMSILLKDLSIDLRNIFCLNILVSVAIIDALRLYQIPELSIKWPNDIMSGNKKIGGVLIENIIKGESAVYSIVGLGFECESGTFFKFAASIIIIRLNRQFLR